MVLPVPGLPVKTRWRDWLEGRQAPLGPQQLHPGQVGDQLDLGLHLVEADELVQLGQQLVERPGRGSSASSVG